MLHYKKKVAKNSNTTLFLLVSIVPYFILPSKGSTQCSVELLLYLQKRCKVYFITEKGVLQSVRQLVSAADKLAEAVLL
jgi:hypothetical protein